MEFHRVLGLESFSSPIIEQSPSCPYHHILKSSQYPITPLIIIFSRLRVTGCPKSVKVEWELQMKARSCWPLCCYRLSLLTYFLWCIQLLLSLSFCIYLNPIITACDYLDIFNWVYVLCHFAVVWLILLITLQKIALTTVLALYCCYYAPLCWSFYPPLLPLFLSLYPSLSLSFLYSISFFCLSQVVNSEDAHRLRVCSKVSDYWNAVFPCHCCQEPAHERMLILNKLIINNKRGWLGPNKITFALICDKYNLTWLWLHIWLYINWFVFY